MPRPSDMGGVFSSKRKGLMVERSRIWSKRNGELVENAFLKVNIYNNFVSEIKKEIKKRHKI